ncbi:hypothetical protein DNTS_025864 [Danionella cerebrum]|uniref:BZIP domain-containing protein n=1 Tax=Danionella cerebrum TaxID=2873325 RepID=A0A553NA63_9TELE|nr:hypothetical protein DNTS_025864 [Danionella translucida]
MTTQRSYPTDHPTSSTGEIFTSKDEPEGFQRLPSITSSSIGVHRLFHLPSYRNPLLHSRRRKREMTPTEKKDANYWDKRKKNNEAAKRSREKRRLNDFVMEGQLLALSEENAQLRAEVLSLQYHMGIKQSLEASPHVGGSYFKPPLWGLGLPPKFPELYHCWPQHRFSPFSYPLKTSPKSANQPSQVSYLDSRANLVETNPPSQQQVSSGNDPPFQPQPFPAQKSTITSSLHPLPSYSSLSLHPSPLPPKWPPSLPLSLWDTDGSRNGVWSIWKFDSRYSSSRLSAESS